jgi:hypothetical protein
MMENKDVSTSLDHLKLLMLRQEKIIQKPYLMEKDMELLLDIPF